MTRTALLAKEFLLGPSGKKLAATFRLERLVAEILRASSSDALRMASSFFSRCGYVIATRCTVSAKRRGLVDQL